MANTPSNMLPLGTTAPYFELPDTISDTLIDLETVKGKNGTVIMFICNHCPFVIHVCDEIIAIAKAYLKKGIGFAAISSNDAIKYPQDGPDKMKIHAKSEKFPFPYLYDGSQDIAKAYEAACTPDFYVFNKDLKLVYRGQLDDSRPGNGKPVTGSDLRHALDCLIEDKENSNPQKPSIGCNIKWKIPE
ncbi:AhpC/TSA family protein [Mariniflexile rhizosphaerae]|uniref:thioredoxin family protein n=1 Tax=unclassified Mariniflexile TaxID=2643887 RepID=UPI000CA7C204|nr:thioredoxin family protein [Mariniflexile sp. TRM1-10]AXP79235.1 AhpC/TSA family protein [Mariniflexile sp. TRM1-10]PLB17717.1 MAG: Alkyl hydroperoxide reductase [Flavobacteriaceae bacterium FS1-H7996/R]